MKERYKMLLSYIKSNVAPILVDFISSNEITGAVVLPANIDRRELNCHYDGLDFVPPNWLKEIINSNDRKVLVIDNIDTISKNEQLKFCELLKYRKISTFNLPDSCTIIITANEINSDNINEEVFSLVARI